MYEARHISLEIRGKTILDDVGVKLRPGLFTALVGPNGAGKSSILKVMAGEQRASAGDVHINGNALSAYRAGELSLLRAVLPQHSTIQFAFTVGQIVMLGRHPHRSTKAENEMILDEIMELTDTRQFSDRNYMTLSGGERQRVQLARVLAQIWEETVHPRYLLLDEPTASLDIAQQQYVFSLAKQICERNIGVLAVIHDLNQAVQYADELSFLRGGKTVASGPAQEVFTRENIELAFGCKVNVHHDPHNNCPYIIPERPTSANSRTKTFTIIKTVSESRSITI